MTEPQPIEVRRLPEEAALRLTWTDGRVDVLDYQTLRGYCPCAGCQGHGGGPVQFFRPTTAVTLRHIELVGNYALSFLWSDNHSTGIYRFDFLRELARSSNREAEEEPPTTTA